jgi:cell division protein FtsW
VAKKLAFDKVLFTVVLVLLVWGLVMLYSASAINVVQQDSAIFLKQVIAALIGLVAMAVAMHIDYHWLSKPWVVYTCVLTSVGLLVAALEAPALNDTHRWLYFGPLSLQPAEVAKLTVVLFLAYQIDRKWELVNSAKLLIPTLMVSASMVVLILLQPDFGTAGLLLLTVASMLFLAGLAWRYIFAAGFIALPALWFLVISVPYRRARLMTFLDPGQDPFGSGFQINQSLIAVGSGGLFGVGLGQSVQKLHFLPRPESDFIFSILSEELGLVGSIALLALFALLLWRGVRAGTRAPETFGRFLAWGLSGMIVLQALINIGVVLSLLPTTGAPLPLMSSGGSSLVTTLAACGLVLNVSQHG